VRFEFDSIGKSFTKIVFAGKPVQSAQSTTVRDVNGLYLDQEGMQILLFRKALFIFLRVLPELQLIDLWPLESVLGLNYLAGSSRECLM